MKLSYPWFTRSFTRRRFVGSSLSIAALAPFPRVARAFSFSAGAPACQLLPEQEEGPYYVADELLRAEIAEGKPGVPLALQIQIVQAGSCQPLPGAAVDIWHCDALGVYSGFTAQGGGMGPGGPGGPPNGGPPNGGPPPGGPPPDFSPGADGHPPGPPGGMGPGFAHGPTDHLTFLRGIQLTGADGSVNFQTVFPGFYMGRTNHIHLKVRVGGHASGKSYAAGHTSHTGQIFFPEQVAAELMQQEPYSAHKIHRITQSEDFVFGGQHGDLAIAELHAIHPAKFAEGVAARIVVIVDPAATPAPVGIRGGPGGPRGRSADGPGAPNGPGGTPPGLRKD